GERGGKVTNRRGITRPRREPKGRRVIRACGSASILHGASRRRAEEGRGDRFSPCWGRGGQLPFSPSKTNK
ncbi:hypothetical protein CN238_35170, partial [Sinorhizobium meliloti]